MVIMEQKDASIRSLPLSFLPTTTRNMLSDLLNSPKLFPTDGPQKLSRDWRGLADLANISSEVQASIRASPDQTARVLELWMRDPSVVVGNLLDNLIQLDRYDVYDDLCEDLAVQVAKKDHRIALQNNRPPVISIDEEEEILTYDDRRGYRHMYDAYVLYAESDEGFVNELRARLESQGFQICTKQELLPGQTTYPRLAKLISERCQRIILVYSPEFLDSSAETFFRDYAQAITIDSRENKIIPIMYRNCHLPAHLAVYHNLRYDSSIYNFWEKLAHTVNISRMPRIMPSSSPVTPRIQISQAHSAVNIVEVSSSQPSQGSLQVHDRLTHSVSLETLELSSPNGSIASDTSDFKKKKPTRVKAFLKKLTGKKTKHQVGES